mgnify:CR=1 FL=1
MSTPTAKDLLAQADRLMRQRTPEELPVLTDLVIEEIEITSLTDRMDDVIPTHARPAWAPVPARAPVASPAPNPYLAAPARVRAPLSDKSAPSNVADELGALPRLARDTPNSSPARDAVGVASAASAGVASATAAASAREQLNATFLAKLEELQHGVYSQVMQQLEIYSSGSLKTHLRETLLPALTDIARDIAEQVAEDTANQVREIVSKAVESEIARLREQLSAKRRS